MLKRLLLLVSLLTLGAGSLRAQESLASQTFKQGLRGKYLHNDTAQAIINLHGTRQAGGASWIVAAALAAARIATSPNRTTSGTSYGGSTMQTSEGSNAGVAFLLATPIMAYGAGKIIHYSNAKLERILAAYAAGQPLAPALRRKLKPRFFQVPIIKYAPVNARPVK